MNIRQRIAGITIGAALIAGGVAMATSSTGVSAWGNGHICWKGHTYIFPNETSYYAFLGSHEGAVEGDCQVEDTTTTTEAATTTTTIKEAPTTTAAEEPTTTKEDTVAPTTTVATPEQPVPQAPPAIDCGTVGVATVNPVDGSTYCAYPATPIIHEAEPVAATDLGTGDEPAKQAVDDTPEPVAPPAPATGLPSTL